MTPTPGSGIRVAVELGPQRVAVLGVLEVEGVSEVGLGKYLACVHVNGAVSKERAFERLLEAIRE